MIHRMRMQSKPVRGIRHFPSMLDIVRQPVQLHIHVQAAPHRHIHVPVLPDIVRNARCL